MREPNEFQIDLPSRPEQPAGGRKIVKRASATDRPKSAPLRRYTVASSVSKESTDGLWSFRRTSKQEEAGKGVELAESETASEKAERLEKQAQRMESLHALSSHLQTVLDEGKESTKGSFLGDVAWKAPTGTSGDAMIWRLEKDRAAPARPPKKVQLTKEQEKALGTDSGVIKQTDPALAAKDHRRRQKQKTQFQRQAKRSELESRKSSTQRWRKLGKDSHDAEFGASRGSSVDFEVWFHEQLAMVETRVSKEDGEFVVIQDEAQAMAIYRSAFDRIIRVLGGIAHVASYARILGVIKHAYETTFASNTEKTCRELQSQLIDMERSLLQEQSQQSVLEIKTASQAMDINNLERELERTQNRLNHYVRADPTGGIEANNRSLADIQRQTKIMEENGRKIAMREKVTEGQEFERKIKAMAEEDPTAALAEQHQTDVYGNLKSTIERFGAESFLVAKYKRRNLKLRKRIKELTEEMERKREAAVLMEKVAAASQGEAVSFAGTARAVAVAKQWRTKAKASLVLKKFSSAGDLMAELDDPTPKVASPHDSSESDLSSLSDDTEEEDASGVAFQSYNTSSKNSNSTLGQYISQFHTQQVEQRQRTANEALTPEEQPGGGEARLSIVSFDKPPTPPPPSKEEPLEKDVAEKALLALLDSRQPQPPDSAPPPATAPVRTFGRPLPIRRRRLQVGQQAEKPDPPTPPPEPTEEPELPATTAPPRDTPPEPPPRGSGEVEIADFEVSPLECMGKSVQPIPKQMGVPSRGQGAFGLTSLSASAELLTSQLPAWDESVDLGS